MRNNDQAFIKAENEGRIKALAVLNDIVLDDADDYTIIPSSTNCKWDFEVRDNKTKGTIAIIEAKDRRFPHNDIKIIKGGCQLESAKYNVLKTKAKAEGIRAYYLATFTDNKAYMWDIMSAPTTIDKRLANKCTAEDRGKIIKEFHYFQSKDSIIGEYSIDLA